jgi:hypothetical protein
VRRRFLGDFFDEFGLEAPATLVSLAR